MTNLLASPWIPTAVLVLLALAGRLLSRSRLAPSAFAPVVWSVYVTLPLVLAPEYEASASAVWLIVLLVFSIQLGAFCGEGDVPAGEQTLSEGRFDTVRLGRVILLFAALAVAGVIYLAGTTLAENDLSVSPLGFSRWGTSCRSRDIQENRSQGLSESWSPGCTPPVCSVAWFIRSRRLGDRG